MTIITRLFCAFLCMLISSLGFAESAWVKEAYQVLPEPIAHYYVGKTTQADVEKELKKAALINKNKHYYIQNNFKYALELSYENKILKSLHYTFTNKHPDIKSLKIELNQFKPQSELFLIYKDDAGEIVLDNISKKIYSIKITK